MITWVEVLDTEHTKFRNIQQRQEISLRSILLTEKRVVDMHP